MGRSIQNTMIHVITAYSRPENKDLLIKHLEGKVNWTVLTDLDDKFPSWVNVIKLYVEEGWRPDMSVFNQWLDLGIEDETQYMFLNDDGFVEEPFWEKIPDENIVIVSAKRGEHIPNLNKAFENTPLIADEKNMRVGYVDLEQMIVKGKILKNYRFSNNPMGDGILAESLVGHPDIVYLKDVFMLFNYLEDGRFDSFNRTMLK